MYRHVGDREELVEGDAEVIVQLLGVLLVQHVLVGVGGEYVRN